MADANAAIPTPPEFIYQPPQEQGDYEADKKASRAFVKAKAAPVEAASIPIIPQEELELVISQTMLSVSGVIKEHGNPAIHTVEMDKELNAIYHEAKSVINSLTLKQVLEVIGEDEIEHGNKGPAYRNQLRALQRKSAERIYGGKSSAIS